MSDNPMYPNGRCPACGQGLTDDFRCQNLECSNNARVIGNERKLYRTVYKVEVLSEGRANDLSIEDLAYAITDGDCSGDVTVESEEEVTPERMAELLVAQGSDPGFFGLDEDED